MQSSYPLPPELVRKILLHAPTDSYPESDPSIMRLHITFPWSVAAVCRTWRAVALSTPVVWTRIHPFRHKCRGTRTYCTTAHSTYLCHLQLERSGSAPLTVTFSKPNRCRSDTAFLRYAANAMDRWETLYLSLDTIKESEFLSILPRNASFANIRRLNYTACSEHTWELPTDITFPQLSRLRLSSWSDMELNIPSFPWSRLTVLDLQHYAGDGGDLLLHLRDCPNLELLRVHDRTGQERQRIDSIPDIIDLQHLLHLELAVGERPSLLLDILSYIRVPRLRILSFSRLTDEGLELLCGLLIRSTPPVTSLQLSFSFADLRQLFPLLPSLTELHIATDQYPFEADLDDLRAEFFRDLVIAQDTTPLLPQLKRMRFVLPTCDFYQVIQIVESRSQSTLPEGVSPLELLEVHWGALLGDFPLSEAELASGSRKETSPAELYEGFLRERLEAVGGSDTCRLVFDRRKFVPTERTLSLRRNNIVLEEYCQ